MSASRRWALVGARFITGLVGVAAALATVGAATLLPWPSHSVEPSGVLVNPVATEQLRVCPGPLLALAADASAASAASSIGTAATAYAAGTASAITAADVTVSALAVPDNVAGDAAGTPLLIANPVSASGEAGQPLLAGSQAQNAATDTLAGFAAAGCAEASTDSWLVAGSTAIGHTSLVLLSNPTAVPASVDLTVYGEAGLVDAPGSTGIVVQPGSQRVVPVAGLAPNISSPVIHVASRGGQVTASLQQSIIRGLVPGGIELAGATAGPDTAQTIAGFIVPAHIHDDTQSNDSHFHEDDPAVRVLNTGDAAGELTVSVSSDEGGNGTSISVVLEPGIASEVPLAELAAGGYTIRLSSEQPIVAAARSTEKSNASEDLAWFAASQPLGDSTAIVPAAGPAATLRLANSGGAEQRLTLAGGTGAPVAITLPAESSFSLPLAAGSSQVLSGEGLDGVHATVSYQGSAALSSFAINPPGPLASAITVYTR